MNRTPTHLRLQAINCYYTKNFSLVLSIVFSIGVIIFNYTKYSLVLVAPARAYAYTRAFRAYRSGGIYPASTQACESSKGGVA
jgi:hypothetical protein